MSSSRSSTNRPIRLGAIGTGLAMEKLHWPALAQLQDRFQIVAHSDASKETAEHFVSYSGASPDGFHADYRDLLQRPDIDAVLILLPIPLLYDAARAALEAGKHTFCEKPPGANLEQGRAFLALEEQFAAAGKRLLIAENFFYRDDLRLARSLLDQGAVGRLNFMSWRMGGQYVPRAGNFSGTPWRQQPQYRGGPHLDGGVHMIAQIRLLCGDVQRVHGLVQYANSQMGGPSNLTLNLAFVSGAIGNYTALHPEIRIPADPPEARGLRLYGSEATLIFGSAWGEDARTFAIHRADGSVETHNVSGSDGGYYNEWLNFHAAIVHDQPILGTVLQSYKNMHLVLRGLDSAEGAGVVDLSDAPGGLSENPLPLWQPHGAKTLFDGLPCKVTKVTVRD
jgi:predicted dehydrogenase